MVRSPSGDIDIITLFFGQDFSDTQILIDNGSGKNRKIIDVTSTGLSLGYRRALLGMHAFSGNTAFIDIFSYLGTEVIASEELVRGLEWFVCYIYGHPHILSVNEARKKAFWNKFNKKEKIIDVSLMPPCQSNLHNHIMRANYVVYIF
jgi:hypothetical protein